MVRCPTEHDLARFIAGDCDDAERRNIETHGSTCSACRDRLERGTDESLLGDVRRALAGEADAEPSPDWFDASLEEALPRYRVLNRLGTGGMGVVYEAEQKSPQRRVAIKVVKSALLTPSLERRFAHEVETLGRLDHPGIARVFEADAFEVHGERRPFFAMELVDGAPLDRFVAERDLSIRARLELFLKICEALQHAHQKGVLHRDLKPGNILVTPEGQPKIVDFGVARSLGAEADTLHTQAGQLVGTLPYMSPEQVAGNPEDVDTRSDVYGLGLVLYRLLAGRLPYDVEGKSPAEIVRIVGEADHDRLRSVAPRVPEDVETIVSKALERDRDRRYASAGALAEDLRRFLHHEPISARPPSRIYQLRMFARRHTGLVAGSVIAVLALVGGTAISVRQAIRAGQAEADALREARTVERVNEFLLHLMGSGDRSGDPRPRDYSVFQALMGAEEWIASDLADDPLVEASVRVVIGDLHLSRREFEQAAPHLELALLLRERNLPPFDLKIAGAANALGGLRVLEGNLDEGEELLSRALAIYERHRGEKEIEKRVATTLMNLGTLRWERGDLQAAGDTYVEAIEVRRACVDPDDPLLARDLATLAGFRDREGRKEEAFEMMKEAFDIHLASGQPETLSTANMLGYMAEMLEREWRWDEAADLWRDVVATRRIHYEEDHPDLGVALHQFSIALFMTDDLEEATAVIEESTDIYRGHPELRMGLSSNLHVYGEIRIKARDPEAALEALYEAWDLRTELLGPDDELTKMTEAEIREAEALALEMDID